MNRLWNWFNPAINQPWYLSTLRWIDSCWMEPTINWLCDESTLRWVNDVMSRLEMDQTYDKLTLLWWNITTLFYHHKKYPTSDTKLRSSYCDGSNMRLIKSEIEFILRDEAILHWIDSKIESILRWIDSWWMTLANNQPYDELNMKLNQSWDKSIF
jgi:hypothetical protein